MQMFMNKFDITWHFKFTKFYIIKAHFFVKKNKQNAKEYRERHKSIKNWTKVCLIELKFSGSVIPF